MDLIEYIQVSQKRAETGIGAEQDFPPPIFSTWKIYGVSIHENPPAEGDKLSGA